LAGFINPTESSTGSPEEEWEIDWCVFTEVAFLILYHSELWFSFSPSLILVSATNFLLSFNSNSESIHSSLQRKGVKV
jgi:hypothetical protein